MGQTASESGVGRPLFLSMYNNANGKEQANISSIFENMILLLVRLGYYTLYFDFRAIWWRVLAINIAQ